MEYRPLKITVVSAQGIKNVNLFFKMDVYAEVSIAGYPQSKQRTIVDKESGTKPKWNHRMEFVVDEPYLTKPGLNLLFQLKSKRSIRSDKEIGSVTVPIHDLFQGNSSGTDQTVEYQVRRVSGRPKGSLKFSYSFGEKFTNQSETKNQMEYPKKHADEPVTAYPAGLPYAQQQYPPAAYNAYPGQPSGYGYQAPPAGYGYPPQQGYGYPPQQGYGYPPQAVHPPGQKPKKNKMGMGGMGMGLGAGLLGGLLVGDMISDIDESAAYTDGYDDAMGDMGGFDF